MCVLALFTTKPLPFPCSPNNGSALGGDRITISGSHFGTSIADVSVVLNGMPCSVVSVIATQISCDTAPRSSIKPVSVVVTIGGAGGGGIALYDASTVYFRYIDRWSSLTTWQYQEPPREGDTVVVPVGQSILVDVSPPLLNLVLIEGEMIFDNKGASCHSAWEAHGMLRKFIFPSASLFYCTDLTFDAHYIFVNGGLLSVGSEAEPFRNKLTVTLHGDRYNSIGEKDCLYVILLDSRVAERVLPQTSVPIVFNYRRFISQKFRRLDQNVSL